MNVSAQNNTDTGKVRELVRVTSGIPASDGDGVRLTRIVGSPELDMVDPFLMLDRFESDQPEDYIGGFPDHPHRGFETVTYLLDGRMRHWDNAGHEGVIEPGDVQWMTAGRGIIHSEMPEQQNGLLRGFQLWVNLPASRKMTPPAYQEYLSADIPVEKLENGGQVKVIAGHTDQGTQGPVTSTTTEPVFLDVILPEGCIFQQDIPQSHGCMIYVIEGEIKVGPHSESLVALNLGVSGEGERIEISAQASSRFLVFAGRQLNEPVARGGPFVMNTKEEVLQAFEDYREGRF